MTMQECYTALEGDYQDVLGRLYSEALVQRFVGKFLSDQSFQLLESSLKAENYEEAFRALGVETAVTTVDGSYGRKGFVTAALPEAYDYFCACGPLPMLRAVYDATKTSGLLSFEERMGCGFGACMGCTCKTKYGNKRICKDGPVLEKEEIIW